MVTEALEKASLDSNTKLKSVCFAMEGTEIEEDREYFAAQLKRVRPNLSETYTVVSDAIASLATANGDAGGMIVVAKRRAGSLYMNPDGSILRCGGYGHILSNEGSAVWISMRAIKTYLDHTDNNPRCDLSVAAVERAVFGHFGIDDRFDLLVQFYPRWDSSNVVALCKKLARAAVDDGDELCLRLFEDAGRELALLVAGLADKVPAEEIQKDGLSVLCVGSVWDAWHLLRAGFLPKLRDRVPKNVPKVSLMRLKRSAEFGACYLGAKEAGLTLPNIDFGKHRELLHCETMS